MISTVQKRHQRSVMMRAIWWAAAGLGTQGAVFPTMLSSSPTICPLHNDQLKGWAEVVTGPGIFPFWFSAFLWQEEDLSTWQSQGDGLPSAGWTAGASRCFQGSEAYSFCCCFKIRYGSGVCHWYFKKENVSIDFYMNGCILYSSTIYLGSSKCHLFSRQHFLITISSDLTWFLSAPQLCA